MNYQSRTQQPAQYPDPYTALATPAPVRGPGWYPDPLGDGQRWWTGREWTSHVSTVVPPQGQPAQLLTPQVVVNNTTVVSIGARKSVAAAFLLTLFFGPVGMFYSTVLGGLFMGFVLVFGCAVVGTATLGLGVPFFAAGCWFLCILWGCAAAATR